MTSTITFTPEAVKAVLLGAGFAEFTYKNIDNPGFKVGTGDCGETVTVWLKGAGVSDFGPGEGPRTIEAEYAQALDQAGYVVRSNGREVVVAGVKG